MLKWHLRLPAHVPFPGVPRPLARRAEAGAQWIGQRAKRDERVTVVHHIDADGVAAGAIALAALARARVAADPLVVRSLDDVHLELVRQRESRGDALWFCDLGSTAYMHFQAPRLVCDHHELVRDGDEESFAHVNPLLDELPGDSISGAGCAFLVAAALKNTLDLLPLALVGAAGDLQDRQGFHGANRALLEAGSKAGLLRVVEDLAWWGLESRPLVKLFSFGSDPAVPTVSGNQHAAEAFLVQHGIDLGDGSRTWTDLTPEEQQRLRSRLVERFLLTGGSAEEARRLLRPVVRLEGEPKGPTRELREFATLLNSTARYGEPDVGRAVASGDRGTALQKALALRDDHRRHLAASLDAFGRQGASERVAIQVVHAKATVRDTVVGIVCGMALEALAFRSDLVLVGLAYTPEGQTKASGRAPTPLQGQVDLATAMREAAAAVGGQGGGHAGAAGATVPRAAEERFLLSLDAHVARQLGRT